MRHAAPRTTIDRKLNRAGQLVFAAAAYAIAGLSACLVALGFIIAVWSLWQRLGVN